MDLKSVMIKGKGDTHYPVPGKVKGEQTNQGKGCESTALDIYAHLAHGSSSSMACQSNILCSYDEVNYGPVPRINSRWHKNIYLSYDWRTYDLLHI